jgi:hypothetical protein
MPNGLMPTSTHGLRAFVSRYSERTSTSTLPRRQSPRSSHPAARPVAAPGRAVGERDLLGRHDAAALLAPADVRDARARLAIRIEVVVEMHAVDVVAFDHVAHRVEHPASRRRDARVDPRLRAVR